MSGTYEQFFQAIKQRESSNDYSIVNGSGFLGAYQFGEAALIDLGYVKRDKAVYDNKINGGWTGKDGIDSTTEFLHTPAVQDEAAAEWWPILWGRVRAHDLEIYDQQTLNGILLTKSGMIAASHLVGTGALMDFIASGGTHIAKDGNGTPITEYLTLFANYDTPASFVNNLEKGNTINGGDRNDKLQGFEGDDTLNAGGGNDVLKGGIGNDTLNGGNGIDTAVYEGKEVDYKITHNKDGTWTVSHVRGDKTEGVDTLTGIEQVQFSDRTNKLAVNSIETQVDFALVVDTTGSMGSYIGAVQGQMANIVDALLQNGEMDARISIVGFKDPGETTTILNFTDQDDLAARKAAALAAISGIGVGGGGDTPEGDNSGLLHSLTGGAGEYRDSAVARKIALFTDAPVKDTELAGEVSAYAADIGASVASMATVATSFGAVTTVTFDVVDGYVPAPVQIYTILVGFDSSATDSVRDIAENNGGEFFDAHNIANLTSALLEIANIAPNAAPVIDSNGGGDTASITVDREVSEIATVHATDSNGDALTFSLAGGGDAGAFLLDPVSGALSFAHDSGGAILPDADGDGMYDVLVSASDGRSFDAQQLEITVTGEAPGVTLYGGNGQDLLSGNSGGDMIYGGNGQDELYGRGGPDFIAGGNGSDFLSGGGGDDRLVGGQGADQLEGGAGHDLFVFGRDDAVDLVTDFDPFEDSVVLEEGISVARIDIVDYDNDGSPDVRLDFTSGGAAVLLGVSPFAPLDIVDASAAAIAHVRGADLLHSCIV